MSLFRIEIMPLATEDIISAGIWIEERNPPAAARWLTKTEAEIHGLRRFPARCPLAPEAADVGQDIYQLVVGKRRGRYRVLYRIKENEKLVQVLRVVHGMRETLTAVDFEQAGW